MNFGGTIRLNRVGVCVIIGACVLFLLYINTSSIDGQKTETGKSTDAVNLRKLLAAAIKVSKKGGDEVSAVKKGNDIDEKSKGNTIEGVKDPVTKADYNSHCVMYYSLTRFFPGVKIVSEEHKDESDCGTNVSIVGDFDDVKDAHGLDDHYVPAEDITVWIDPLDATKEFTEDKLKYVTTMVCIAVKGEPIIGVIHKPFDEPETYWAWRAKGNSKNLSYNKLSSTAANKIIVSMSHAGAVKNVSEQAFGKNAEIIPAAGAGYKSIEVANGNVDAYVHITHIKKWDICAGDAIIQALGGKMTTLSNSKIDYSSSENYRNEKGLLATMEKHDWYLQKLNSVMKNLV
ncbi:putative inositol monophosphatase 3 [Blattella germanica]|nr:putative inositol monophosphatase 3 [Blattella germanica]